MTLAITDRSEKLEFEEKRSTQNIPPANGIMYFNFGNLAKKGMSSAIAKNMMKKKPMPIVWPTKEPIDAAENPSTTYFLSKNSCFNWSVL